VGFGGGAVVVNWHGVGERADRRGPCISKGRERRRRGWKARIKEENVFPEIHQGLMGRLGRAKGGGSPRGSGPAQRPRPAGLIKGKKNKKAFDFRI
jgi:hypothetical protein